MYTTCPMYNFELFTLEYIELAEDIYITADNLEFVSCLLYC